MTRGDGHFECVANMNEIALAQESRTSAHSSVVRDCAHSLAHSLRRQLKVTGAAQAKALESTVDPNAASG